MEMLSCLKKLDLNVNEYCTILDGSKVTMPKLTPLMTTGKPNDVTQNISSAVFCNKVQISKSCIVKNYMTVKNLSTRPLVKGDRKICCVMNGHPRHIYITDIV